MRIGCLSHPETQPPWTALDVRTVVSHASDGKFIPFRPKCLPAAKPSSRGTNHPLPSTTNEYGIVCRDGASIGFPLRLNEKRYSRYSRQGALHQSAKWTRTTFIAARTPFIRCRCGNKVYPASHILRFVCEGLLSSRHSIQLLPISPPCVSLDNVVAAKCKGLPFHLGKRSRRLIIMQLWQ